MRRLIDERGGVAVTVGVLLAALVGFGAIVVDVGHLYAERRQLQNGADGAALAAAEEFVEAKSDCVGPPSAQATVDSYANANANDANANATYACEDADGNPSLNHVTVFTSTREPGGDNFLTHWLAPIIGDDQSTVVAQATAAWGPLGGSFDLFPLAFCLDTFNQVTSNGTVYGPPPYDIFYKTPSNPIQCPTTNDIYDGGFGWLDINRMSDKFDPATCTVTATFDQWEPGRPGVGLPNTSEWNTCVAKLKAKILEMDADPDAAPLLVPIFDGWRNPGANGEFHLIGFGAWRPTGYHLGGSQWYPDNKVCGGDPQNRCLEGYFVEWVVNNGVISPGGYYGVMTVQLQG